MKRATAHRAQDDRALLLCEPRRLPANDINGASVDGAVVHA